MDFYINYKCISYKLFYWVFVRTNRNKKRLFNHSLSSLIMKNQNSISKSAVMIKPASAVPNKQKTKMMDKEIKQQQIYEEKNNLNSNETLSSIPSDEKVNERIGCHLGIQFR
jgi:hypothetical protein